MNKDELKAIIDQLETANSKNEAYLGIFQYGGGPDESFIKANKQGLELFAAAILRASRDADEIVVDKENNSIPLSYEGEWIDGDTYVQYVELILQKEKDTKKEPASETWHDNAMRFGCLAGLIAAVIAIIIGLFTIVTWIF